jgi:acyl carrier protein
MDSFAAPTLEAVAEIVHEVTGADVAEVRPDATLADLDMDSLSTVEVVIGIEQRLGVRVPDADVAALQTIGDLVAAVERVTA